MVNTIKKCENYYHSYVFHAITPFPKGVETAAAISLPNNYIKCLLVFKMKIYVYPRMF